MLLPLWSLLLGWLLTVVIVIGNGLVIYLITTKRNLRTTTNWFVLSLAVADFGVGAVYYPRRSLCRIYQSCGQEHVVVIAFSVGYFFVYASVTNLCALTLDRYLAIVKPLRYVTFMTKKRVALLIFMAWSVAFLVILIPNLVLYLGTSGKTFAMRKILWLIIAVLCLVVCVWLLYATARIFLIVRKISRQNAAVVAQLNFNHRIQHRVAFKARETTSAKMIGAVVTIFVNCYSLDILDTVLRTGLLLPPNKTFLMLLMLFTLLNSAANPVAYAFFKREITRELNRLLCCKKC